jgi:hypothetical protein
MEINWVIAVIAIGSFAMTMFCVLVHIFGNSKQSNRAMNVLQRPTAFTQFVELAHRLITWRAEVTQRRRSPSGGDRQGQSDDSRQDRRDDDGRDEIRSG